MPKLQEAMHPAISRSHMGADSLELLRLHEELSQ